MKTPPLSDEESARIRRGFALMDESWDEWERRLEENEARYGDGWIAMHGRRIVAFDRDPDVFERKLRHVREERDELFIRWVPPPEMEFVL